MSATKGIASIAIARVVEQGLIDVDAPVARYWPEFATAGKADITVAQLLAHSAGVITIPGYEELLTPQGAGWDKTDEILRRLEHTAPEWTPGTDHGYHALTWGWLVNELVLRVTGISIGTILRTEIAQPLGLELDLGTPAEHQHLVAPVILPGPGAVALSAEQENMFAPDSLFSRALLTVDGASILSTADTFFADTERLAMELPSSNGTSTARSVATLYGALANGGQQRGVRVLDPATIDRFATEHLRGTDRVLLTDTRWALGFQRNIPSTSETPDHAWGPHEETFGMVGYGGQMGFADPVRRLGVGMVRSQLSWDSLLGRRLVDTTYDCLSKNR
jgi:CubicO group peptidase (beta-lactamase class C family)